MEPDRPLTTADTPTAMSSRIEFSAEPLTSSAPADVICLIAFTTLLSLWGLAAGPGLSDHEAFFAVSARNVCEDGHWLIPELNGSPEVRKTPLQVWLAAISSKVVDPASMSPTMSVLAARLPSAIAAILTTALIYALGRSMFGHRTAVICGLCFAASSGALFFSHNAQVEMVLTFFCAASMACFWFATEARPTRKIFMVLFYICLAVAMMAKAPLPLAVVGLPLAVWWFFVVPIARFNVADDAGHVASTHGFGRRVVAQIRGVRRLWILPGIGLFLLLFLPWPIYIASHVQNVLDLWRLEYLARFSGDMSVRVRPFWYYLPIALALVFPFSLSIPEALASPFMAAHRLRRKGLLFLFTWFVVDLLFLSTSAFKRPHYLAAALPALAMLLGPTIEYLFLSARSMSRLAVHAAIGACVVLVPVGAAIGGYFVARQYTEALSSYGAGAAIFTIGAVAAGIVFGMRHRLASLLILCLSVALSFAWSWDEMGLHDALQWQAREMVAKLEALPLKPKDRLTWVKGRPDARLSYYLHRDIEPLFTPLEMAPRREGRRYIQKDLLVEGAGRIMDRLQDGNGEYFIIDVEYWQLLQEHFHPDARELFRVEGQDPEDVDDDWVVITGDQKQNAANQQDQQATTRPAVP